MQSLHLLLFCQPATKWLCANPASLTVSRMCLWDFACTMPSTWKAVHSSLLSSQPNRLRMVVPQASDTFSLASLLPHLIWAGYSSLPQPLCPTDALSTVSAPSALAFPQGCKLYEGRNPVFLTVAPGQVDDYASQ